MKEGKEENQRENREADLGEKRMSEATAKGSLTVVKLDRVVFKLMILSA